MGWIGLVNHFAIVTDALRKRDKGKRKAITSGNSSRSSSLLNSAHQQEINQLKQEKENMKREIERLRRELAQYQGGNSGYNTGTVINQTDLYDVPLDDNTV